MCNDYGNKIPYSEYAEAFSKLKISVHFPEAAPNLEPRDDIWPTEVAPVIRRYGEEIQFTRLRWGFAPGNPKGGPVINFKSEGRRFAGSRRCLVPASHFYEFKGAKSPKSKFKFTLKGEEWFCFAGLWRPAERDVPESFTLLTTEPGPDVAPIHSRQVVVLERENWGPWLDVSKPEAELLRALPPGRLEVEQVR